MACACLSRLVLRQRDAVGLAVVADRLRQFVPPRSSASHLSGILGALRRADAQETTSLASSVLELARRLNRRGIIVIFSDCFTDLPSLGSAIRQLHVRGHEVLVFHVLAPEEVNFAFSKWTRFECLESSVALDLDAPTVRADYLARFQTFLNQLRKELTNCGCDYVQTITDQNLADVLATYLSRRAATVKP